MFDTRLDQHARNYLADMIEAADLSLEVDIAVSSSRNWQNPQQSRNYLAELKRKVSANTRLSSNEREQLCRRLDSAIRELGRRMIEAEHWRT